MITAERRRQVAEEGWTAAHDDEHDDGQLIAAAISYAGWAKGTTADHLYVWWPWTTDWWKPGPDPIRNLVKAGALLAAEIDRRRRAEGDDPYVIPRPTHGAPQLVELGEDGQWLVGYGHVELRVFVCLAAHHLAGTEGLVAAEELIRNYPDIRHVWALEHRWQPEHADERAPVPGVIPGDDYVVWRDVTEVDDRSPQGGPAWCSWGSRSSGPRSHRSTRRTPMGVDETAQSTADEPRRDGERGHPLLRPDGTAKMVVGPVDEQALAAAEAEGYRRGVEAVKHAILDIDAHATGLGEDANGFVSGGYVISIGCLH